MNSEYRKMAAKLEEIAVIPVIKLENSDHAAPLAEALAKAGLPAAEVTFRTEAASRSIEIISHQFPDVLTGAGTVLTIDQVKSAVDSGARFVVSPGFNPRVVDYCVDRGIPVFPGVNNPSGVEAALERGLDVLKFFPAEASGGVAMINAMSAPYGKVRFMATGGINASNLLTYLESPYVAACGGSWMVQGEMIKNGNFDEIERLSAEAVSLVRNWRNR